MNEARALTACVLLAAFVVGGVLGPTAHRIQHAAEHASERGTPVSASHRADAVAVHDGHGSVCLTTAVKEQPDCDLCATRLLLSTPTSAQTPAPAVLPTPTVTRGSALVPASIPAHISIRGPPVRA